MSETKTFRFLKKVRPKHATYNLWSISALLLCTANKVSKMYQWTKKNLHTLKSFMTKNVHTTTKGSEKYMSCKRIRTCLSSNIADPSSNISSTEPKEADLLSFPTELWDLLPKIRDLNLFWFFFGDNAGGVEQWSDGMMSTTTHVVSSFNPLVFRACWTSKMDTN